MTEYIDIEGRKVGYDNSGAGHNWLPATEDNCPPDIQEEIAAEILDGGRDECDDYVATNGRHYRWS